MKIEYKLQDKFDVISFASVCLLIAMGIVAIFSATVNHPTASGNAERQLVWAGVSVIVFFFIYFLPHRTFRLLAVPAYLSSLILLIVVIFAGKVVYGAKSWLALGPFGFQPSEFGKIGLILFLAYWLTHKKRNINNFTDISSTILIGSIPVLLILLEPDLGTAIVYIAVTVFMLFWGGINLFGLFVVVSPGLVVFASLFGTAPLLVALGFILIGLYYFKRNLFTSASVFVANISAAFLFDYALRLLQPHQQRRIASFLDPTADPLGSGYNAMQAKVAIGSGGLLGKGFLEGNQTQLRFIPEQWTDFIYCVIGEEFGFIGSFLTITLFIIVFIRLLDIAYSSKDEFGSAIVIGTLSLYFIHFVINIGMNIGIAPVIGLPLPFLSYGGSSLLVNFMLLGIVFNIYRNRKEKI
ncbi:MAG: rod shape-determining protein RodA [Melioribacteraceae bacterium]|nr:rod shape-determining protein RodA [Melioribacteraceae bacterium]MCF8265056.1 rod shape-determining protein RodA [Melioribacteraceae bacterium]MCF8412455.1 rod shape-determining protein RodA [Melioribacteraceae bacterium]MCF8431913.1 rod shape-determining protein RodA [Melioribacteraceae bacterium]